MLTASGSLALRTVAPPTRGREDEVDSLTAAWTVVGNDDELLRHFRRLCLRLLRNPRPGIFQGSSDAVTGGAADDIVAVERGFEGDGGEEVFAELGADGAEFFEGELLEFAVGFEAEADGVADVLVGLAEGDALVGEVGCRSHGVEVAGVSGSLHGVVAEFEGRGEGGEDA